MANASIASPAPSGIMGLTHTQFFLAMAYGVAGWCLAIVLCRNVGPLGVYEGLNMVALYAAIIPSTVAYIWLGAKLIGLARNQIFVAFVTVDMTALLLDGNAFAWFPSLYGATSDLVVNSAAVIIYAAGIILALAFLMNRSSEC